MANRLSDEEELQKFLEHVERIDKTQDKQLLRFVQWCIDNNLFINTSDEDIQFCYDYNWIMPSINKTNGITIGINEWYGSYRIGISPSKYYNKVRDSSIVIHFPMTSKRAIKKFYQTLDTLMDKKSKLSKEWFEDESILKYEYWNEADW